MHAYSCTLHNNRYLSCPTTDDSLSKCDWMYNGMFSDENDSGNDISREMSGTEDHHGKQTQPCSERQTPHMQDLGWCLCMVKVEGRNVGQGRKLQAVRGGKKTETTGCMWCKRWRQKDQKKRAENEKQCSGRWEKEIKYNGIYVWRSLRKPTVLHANLRN